MPNRRKPNRLKVLEGTDRPDRMYEEAEYPMVEGYPAPPDWLIGPEAVEEWEHKVKLLSDAEILAESDLTALAHYCNMHADAVKRWRLGDKPTAADLTQLRLKATEFGFTPASRSKVGGGGGKGSDNPFEKLKSG